MKKLIVTLFFILISLQVTAQEDSLFVDNKYLEDQLYLGIQYSRILSSNSIVNNGIPYSFQIGFIKDIPVNKQRNIGFGIGVGYSYDVVRPSITITNNEGVLEYAIDDSYSSYKYSSNNLEFPLEFRWRKSTATKYSFWRVYSGASLVYNLGNKVAFDTGSESVSFTDIDAWRTLNYTVYTSIGFGTWNVHVKYFLNPFLKDNTFTTDGESLKFYPLKLGVMFYIL